jgi:hypothetical protein
MIFARVAFSLFVHERVQLSCLLQLFITTQGVSALEGGRENKKLTEHPGQFVFWRIPLRRMAS